MRRPKASDSEPSTGEAKNWMPAKVAANRPTTWAAGPTAWVKLLTRLGSTGTTIIAAMEFKREITVISARERFHGLRGGSAAIASATASVTDAPPPLDRGPQPLCRAGRWEARVKRREDSEAEPQGGLHGGLTLGGRQAELAEAGADAVDM